MAKTTTPQMKKVMDGILALGKSADAANVLLAVQLLSEDLRALLTTKMPNLDTKLAKELFHGYGPLQDVAPRIALCFALGIIDKDLNKDLNRLRDIRNKFGHPTEPINLERGDIVNMMSEFSISSKGIHPRKFFRDVVEDIKARIAQAQKAANTP